MERTKDIDTVNFIINNAIESLHEWFDVEYIVENGELIYEFDTNDQLQEGLAMVNMIDQMNETKWKLLGFRYK